MKNNILVALNNSITSRLAVEFLINLSLKTDSVKITLLHVLRKPSSQEELMGKKFGKEQISRVNKLLDDTKSKLLESGFTNVENILAMGDYQTVTDAIIEQFEKGNYSMLLIGRKHMSKSEEFIMGDISVKLIRNLKETAIIVVKSK